MNEEFVGFCFVLKLRENTWLNHMGNETILMNYQFQVIVLQLASFLLPCYVILAHGTSRRADEGNR